MVCLAPEAELPPGCERLCPACKHRSYSKTKSESIKQKWVEERIGDRFNVPVSPLQSLDGLIQGYREKVCLRAQWNPERGHWALGFLPAGDPRKVGDQVVEIPHCPVHSERVREVHRVIAQDLPQFLNKESERIEIPLVYVLISGGFLTLVLKCAPTADFDSLMGALAALAQLGIEGVFLNFNAAAGNRILSSRGWRHLWGAQTLIDRQGFHYGPNSFQQLIPKLYQSAVDRSVEFLQPKPGDWVVDLYSGCGSTLVRWKAHGADCLGVELGAEAVACSEKNVGQAYILRGKTSERLPQLEAWVTKKMAGARESIQRLAYVNPPRTGLETETVSWLTERYRPERLAYLSCSAGTLARDLSVFLNSGYALAHVIPYDFFPQTHHVETLALLERLS